MVRAAGDGQESRLTLLSSMGAQRSNEAEGKGHDLEIETHREKMDPGGSDFGGLPIPKHFPPPFQNGNMSNENTAARIL